MDDNRRLCEFVYRNLGAITQIVPSLDTHRAMQVFHPVWLIDGQGKHPAPYTLVSAEDIESGRWRLNPEAPESLGIDSEYAARELAYYTRRLAEGGKYQLTIWPYHALLGGIGHALVSAVEEAFFFHGIARSSQPDFQVKGEHPLTEHYSMLGPEVTEGPDGEPLARRNTALVERLLEFDAVIVAGQAKSHCVAWTIDDLLEGDDARVHSARRARVPARGLHVAGGRPRRRRLHGRGGCGVRALRPGRNARRALDHAGRRVARHRRARLGGRQLTSSSRVLGR